MSGVSMKVSYQLRKEISEKINRMPFRYFDETNQGEVLSRVTNDVDTLSQTLNQSLRSNHYISDNGHRCADHDVLNKLANDVSRARNHSCVDDSLFCSS